MTNAIDRLRELAGPSSKGRGPLTAAPSFLRRHGGPGGFYPDDEKGEARSEKDLKAGTEKLKSVYQNLLAKALQRAVDGGVQKQWAKDYFSEYLDECIAELEDTILDKGPSATGEVIQNLKGVMNGDSVITDFGAHSNSQGIEKVKQAGQKLFSQPSQKIAILKKLNLTGAEFHAFCLMVKEQIK